MVIVARSGDGIRWRNAELHAREQTLSAHIEHESGDDDRQKGAGVDAGRPVRHGPPMVAHRNQRKTPRGLD